MLPVFWVPVAPPDNLGFARRSEFKFLGLDCNKSDFLLHPWSSLMSEIILTWSLPILIQLICCSKCNVQYTCRWKHGPPHFSLLRELVALSKSMIPTLIGVIANFRLQLVCFTTVFLTSSIHTLFLTEGKWAHVLSIKYIFGLNNVLISN